MSYEVVLYTKPACVQCDATKRWFASRGVEYEAIDVTQDETVAEQLGTLGYKQLPVVTLTDPETKDVVHWSGYAVTKLEAHLGKGTS